MENELSSHMLLIEMLIKVALYFGIAGMIVPLLQICRVSPVLGYLICGTVIGPYGIAKLEDAYPWIQYISVSDSSSVHLVGELGIITLMFKIGLDLSIDRLMELKKYIFGLGTLQIVISAFFIFLVARYYNNSLEASILLGLSLALSSTAIVMKLLEEKKLTNRPIGILCFSVLLMQDLAVVPILILTSVFVVADMNIFVAITEAAVFGIITVLVVYWLGRKVLTPLLRSISFSTTHEWLTSIVIFLVLFFSLVTYKSGLSLALGAFIVGLLIAETEFKHEVKIVISPIKGVLLGIFFLSIGMMINVQEIFNNFALIAMSVVGILVLKSVIIFSICMVFRVPLLNAIETSIYLSEPGEFALMILGAALAGGVLPPDDAKFFLLVTVVAMMITPFVFKIGPIISNYIGTLLAKDPDTEPLDLNNETGYVVICGFGKVGRLIADALTMQMIPYIAFEMNAKIIQEAKKNNYNVNYGDVRLGNFWGQLVSKKVDIAVLAIDDFDSTKLTIKSIRKHFPMLPVYVRCKDSLAVSNLCDLGATDVVAEALETSLRISRVVMEQLGIPEEEARNSIKSIRDRVLTEM